MALPNGDLITTVFDPQMAYPVDKRMQVDTLNSRDSISMFIRWEGMTVYVLEDSKIYILQGGRSNEYWNELGTGSGTGGTTFVGQFATSDLLPTSGRSAGDYAFVGTGDDFVQYNWDNIANEWVMAEGQTDMASEFFHIGYKTPLRRPVIFPLFPKDVLVQESGDFVFTPETAVARFIFVGEVEAIRGIETAEEDREIKLVNRTGSDIPLRDKASGIPSGSGMDFGGTDYTLVNGSEITLKGNGTYWQLAPNNQIAFSDHLDSVNAHVSVGSDELEVITGVFDKFTGHTIQLKEVNSWIDGTSMSDIKTDGYVYLKHKGKYFADAAFLDEGAVHINRLGAKGDGSSDDTASLNLAVSIANSLQAPLIGGGRYLVKNTIDLRRIPSADLDLVVADDFEDDYVVSFANIPSRSRSYTIRIDGRNVEGVTGIQLQDPTIAQLYIKTILYRLERGVHVYRNAEKLKLDILAYSCGTVVEENASTTETGYHTPDENHFNITGSGNKCLYHCSAGVPTTNIVFNAEGNFTNAQKAIVIEDLDPPPGVGKLVTLAGSIRGFECAVYINNPEACVDFNNLYLNDGGRVERYTENEANALLPAVKVVSARTITGRINLRPTYVNTLQIDRLTQGGDLDVMITNFRANCVKIGNEGNVGSVNSLNLKLHASSPLAIFDNYVLKVCENVISSKVNLLATGGRKIILDSRGVDLTIPNSVFIGAGDVIEGSVTKLPILVSGELTHGMLNSYPYKIKGMRAFNSTLQRWVSWDGFKWQSDSFSTFDATSIIIDNPVGGILDTGSISSTGALVLKFPYIPTSGPQGLYEIDLEILDYGTPSQNKSMSFKIVGTHGLSTSPSWDRTYASANDFNGRNLPVRFGFDSQGYPSIVIGETTSIWLSLHARIVKIKRTRKVISGYDSTYMDQPWSLSVQSDISAITINTTINNAYSWGDYNKLVNTENVQLKRQDVVVSAANHTLLLSQIDSYIRFTGTAGNISVPSVFLPEQEQWGEIEGGAKTFVAGAGVTLRYPDGQGLVAPTGSRFIIKFKSPNDALVTIIKPYTSTVPNASTTQRGIIEQATDAETITGTDTERAVSPANLQAKLDALILSETATLDFPTISAGETERLTATVTGAALLDPVLVSGPADIYNANNSTIDAWVSAANTVTVRVRNNGSSSIDPGEGQFKIKVFK